MSEESQKPKAQCIIEGCVNDVKTRGLCSSCYTGASKAVKGGTVTWDRLVGLELALASRQGSNAKLFDKALAGRLDSSVGAPNEAPSDGTEPDGDEPDSNEPEVAQVPDAENPPVKPGEGAVAGKPVLPWAANKK